MRVTQPFDFAQGRESFDFAQDREPVERPVERQMGVFRQPQEVTLQEPEQASERDKEVTD